MTYQLNDTVLGLLRNPECPDYVLRDAILDSTGYDMAKVYVVAGHTGEYSDYSSWTVAAFLDANHATAFCGTLNAWCKEQGVSQEDAERVSYRHRSGLTCPLDPQFHCDYTGTQYDIETIPLRAD